MKEILWYLFRNTGELKYFIFLKELENNNKDEDRKSKRNSN